MTLQNLSYGTAQTGVCIQRPGAPNLSGEAVCPSVVPVFQGAARGGKRSPLLRFRCACSSRFLVTLEVHILPGDGPFVSRWIPSPSGTTDSPLCRRPGALPHLLVGITPCTRIRIPYECSSILRFSGASVTAESQGTTSNSSSGCRSSALYRVSSRPLRLIATLIHQRSLDISVSVRHQLSQPPSRFGSCRTCSV